MDVLPKEVKEEALRRDPEGKSLVMFPSRGHILYAVLIRLAIVSLILVGLFGVGRDTPWIVVLIFAGALFFLCYGAGVRIFQVATKKPLLVFTERGMLFGGSFELELEWDEIDYVIPFTRKEWNREFLKNPLYRGKSRGRFMGIVPKRFDQVFSRFQTAFKGLSFGDKLSFYDMKIVSDPGKSVTGKRMFVLPMSVVPMSTKKLLGLLAEHDLDMLTVDGDEDDEE